MKGLPSFELKNALNQAFEQFQIIGEGTDFLTVKIDLPQDMIPISNIHALVVDTTEAPLTQVSGYTHHPQLREKNHLWFYFFLYSPRRSIPFQKESEYIKFFVTENRNFVTEKTVYYRKSWGSEDEARILDLPSPPDHIDGFLVLRDYTFLATGDLRKPEGFHIQGKINGSKGRWDHFTVLSSILGNEPEQEHSLPVDRGWIELKRGNTHSIVEAIAPTPPYVEGWWDGKGHFHPEPPVIHDLQFPPPY